MTSKIFFDFLNSSKCEYVVFDIYVSNNETILNVFVSPHSFNETVFYLESKSIKLQPINEHCLYGMKKILLFKGRDFVCHIFSRPAIKSLDCSWVPLNKIVQEQFLLNRVKNHDYYFLSPADEFFYLICKNVFNNRFKGFDKLDVERIKYLKKMNCTKSKDVYQMFESVFFKFTPELIDFVNNNQFDSIFASYVSFKDY